MVDAPQSSDAVALLDALARVEQRLARIEQRLCSVEEAGKPALAIAVDSFDTAARTLEARGVDVAERVATAALLLERVTERETAGLITRALELMRSAPSTLALLVDVADQRVAAAEASGIALEARLAGLVQLLEVWTRPALLRGLLQLESRGLGELAARTTRALATAQAMPSRPVGVLGLWRALADRQVQHALGFALTFARSFGRDTALQPVAALTSEISRE